MHVPNATKEVLPPFCDTGDCNPVVSENLTHSRYKINHQWFVCWDLTPGYVAFVGCRARITLGHTCGICDTGIHLHLIFSYLVHCADHGE
jgi:hypothetical protein